MCVILETIFVKCLIKRKENYKSAKDFIIYLSLVSETPFQSSLDVIVTRFLSKMSGFKDGSAFLSARRVAVLCMSYTISFPDSEAAFRCTSNGLLKIRFICPCKGFSALKR